MSRTPRLAALVAALFAVITSSAAAAPTWLPGEPTGALGSLATLREDGSATLFGYAGADAKSRVTGVKPPRSPWGATSPFGVVGDGQEFDQQVRRLPDGTVVAVWARGVGKTPHAILTASQRPGEAWSDPVELTASADWEPIVTTAVAPDGTLTAAWAASDHTLRFAQRRPDGVWGAPEQVPGIATLRDTYALAVDAAGRISVLAMVGDILNIELKATEQAPGGSWTTPDTIPTGSNPRRVALVITADGRRWAFWGQESPGAIKFATRLGGGAWSAVQDGPAVSAAVVNELLVEVGGDGELTVLWAEGPFNSPSALKTASRTQGGWSATTTLRQAGVTARITGMRAASWNAGLMVAWTDEDRGAMVARRTGGAWETPTILAPAIGAVGSLSVLPDGDALVSVTSATNPSDLTTYRNVTRALDANGPRVGAVQSPGATAGAPASITVDAVDRFSDIASVAWDFGDGSPAVTTPAATAAHTWAQPGTYAVRVTATDAVGNATSGQGTVTVAAAPTPAPTPAPAPTPSPQSARPAPELRLLADGFGKQLLLGKRRIPVVLSCGRYDCSVRLRATLLVGKRTVGTLPTVRGTIAARKKKTFFLETTVAQRRTMRAAVRRGRDAAVRVRVRATTSAGTSRAEQRISLRDLG